MSFPQTTVDTEEVFSRLFALAMPLRQSTTPFNTMSRRFQIWTKISRAQMPAFYQMEIPQELSGGDRGVIRQTLRAWWFVYLDPPVDPEAPSVRMNRYRDALLNLLLPTPRQPVVNLGIPGVLRVYADGLLLMDEGLMEPPSLIRIPITILTGN